MIECKCSQCKNTFGYMENQNSDWVAQDEGLTIEMAVTDDGIPEGPYYAKTPQGIFCSTCWEKS